MSRGSSLGGFTKILFIQFLYRRRGFIRNSSRKWRSSKLTCLIIWKLRVGRKYKILIWLKWYGFNRTRSKTMGEHTLLWRLHKRVSPYQFNHVNGHTHKQQIVISYIQTLYSCSALSFLGVSLFYPIKRETNPTTSPTKLMDNSFIFSQTQKLQLIIICL